MYMELFAIFFIFARESEGFEEFGVKIDKKSLRKINHPHIRGDVHYL